MPENHEKNEILDIFDIFENLTFLKILDIFENFGHFWTFLKILDISDSLKIIQKHKKAEKSKVISDRPTDRPTDRLTDIVNYRVALTRLKRWGLASIVDLTLYRNKRKKRWVLAQLWIWFNMKYEEKQRKKKRAQSQLWIWFAI